MARESSRPLARSTPASGQLLIRSPLRLIALNVPAAAVAGAADDACTEWA